MSNTTKRFDGTGNVPQKGKNNNTRKILLLLLLLIILGGGVGAVFYFSVNGDDDGPGIPDIDSPNSTPEDLDGDGVRNLFDRCPETPEGIKVNEDGCADKDGDGFSPEYSKDDPEYDYDDNDPNITDTKPDIIDEDEDEDEDNIDDTKDLCPGTQRGVKVNKDGCEDKDGDGYSPQYGKGHPQYDYDDNKPEVTNRPSRESDRPLSKPEPKTIDEYAGAKIVNRGGKNETDKAVSLSGNVDNDNMLWQWEDDTKVYTGAEHSKIYKKPGKYKVILKRENGEELDSKNMVVHASKTSTNRILDNLAKSTLRKRERDKNSALNWLDDFFQNTRSVIEIYDSDDVLIEDFFYDEEFKDFYVTETVIRKKNPYSIKGIKTNNQTGKIITLQLYDN